MWPLAIEFGILDSRHARAVGLHLLGLGPDDRYARFGLALSDEAVLRWVAAIRWPDQRWMGAWAGHDAVLVGALQLAPAGRVGVWELALAVSQPLRRQGLGTALLATALRDDALARCHALVCQHGHAAVAGMARRLGLQVQTHAGEPRMLLQRAQKHGHSPTFREHVATGDPHETDGKTGGGGVGVSAGRRARTGNDRP